MSNVKAIATLAVGGEYEQRWRSVCEANWKQYADRHGYDLYCFTSPLDDSERARQRSPAWQKCLILSQDFARRYERVVWVDSDILINPSTAPCIAAGVPPDKVGGVDAWSWPTADVAQLVLSRMYEYWGEDCTVVDWSARDYYRSYGLPPVFDQVVQTGVLVMSPQHHRPILENVYHAYEETGQGNFEMRPLSYELLKAGAMHWIDQRFNAIWFAHKALYYPFLLNAAPPERGIFSRLRRVIYPSGEKGAGGAMAAQCATAAFMNNFFLHFAGANSDMTLVDLKAASWRDL